LTVPPPPRPAACTRTSPGRATRNATAGDRQLAPGTRVGELEIEQACGEGGFAVVYRARRLATGEPVALKVLRPHLAATRSMQHRFAHEAAALQRLRHPNIVRYLGAGQLASGPPYIVMEWLEGHDLGVELARRGPLALAEAIAVLGDVCKALAAAHALGIVHRDLKASNVMTVPRGDWFEVRLCDFGIAKQCEAGLASGTSSVILGTPRNMAPEQILGQRIDLHTDIYALGLLAYQLVTGRLPFEASDPAEIEELHLNAPPPRASDVAPVPPGFDALVARCLRKTPGERFANVAAFMSAATALLEPPGSYTAMQIRVEVQVRGETSGFDETAFDEADATLEAVCACCSAAGAELVANSGAVVMASVADAGQARALVERLEAALERARQNAQLLVQVAIEAANPERSPS
jgi:serine/threonine-protein kinase